MATNSEAQEKRECRKLRKQGLTREEIAKKTGLSLRTVARRLAGADGSTSARTSAPATPTPIPTAPAGPPPSPEELDGWLIEQIASQRSEAQRAQQVGDTTAFQRASKALVSLFALHSKTRPADDSDVIRCNRAEVEEASNRAKSKLMDLRNRIEAERASWPKCPTCSQPVKPQQGVLR